MATGFTDVAMPYFKAMHEMTPEHVHEEVQLQTLTLATMLLETQWHVAELPRLVQGDRPDSGVRVPEAGAAGTAVAARWASGGC